jgi:hypothetical protein
MNDSGQTPLQEAISFLTIVAILVAVGCYVAGAQNIPIASPALSLGCFNDLTGFRV